MNTQTPSPPLRRRARTAALALTALSLTAALSLTESGAAPGDPRATGELTFSSYLGGLEWDEGTGAAADRDGNTYVTGFTLSEDFPRVGAGTRDFDAIVDAFVTKVSADGTIVWSTQLGGADMDMANAVTVDRRGNVYVVGRTGSRDFPTSGGFQDRLRGRSCTGVPCHDAFVVKLDPSGQVRWSTLLGGSLNEEAVSVAIGGSRAVYVAGLTDSRNLPVRRAFQGEFQSPPCQGDVPCPYDGFVTKLAPSGDDIVYSTYLGGKATDVARGIDVDSAGNAYVAGSTGSPDFPTVRAFQDGTRGEACGPPPGEPCRQAFLTKLRPNGSDAAYSTYLGGREHDDAFGVAVDDANRAHVTGSTQSPLFPTREAFQPTMRNGACTGRQPEEPCDDGFVTRFARDGRSLRYSTYVGGRAEDQGLSIAITPTGQALVAGRTDSTNFPTTADAAQPEFGGYIDGFAMRLRRGGAPLWSTFLGGSDADRATGVAADGDGDAHLTGRTLSTDFPTQRPFQPTLKDDDYDAFVSVIR